MRSLSFSRGRNRLRSTENDAKPVLQRADQCAAEVTGAIQPLTEPGRELQQMQAPLEALHLTQKHEQSLHAAVLEQRDREKIVLEYELKQKVEGLASLEAQHQATLNELLECRQQLAKELRSSSLSEDCAKSEHGTATLVAELRLAIQEMETRSAAQAERVGALEEALAAAGAEQKALAITLGSQEQAGAEHLKELSATRETIDVCRSILASIPGVLETASSRSEDGVLSAQYDVVLLARGVHKLKEAEQAKEKGAAVIEAEARVEETEATLTELRSHCDALEAQLSALRVREAKHLASESDVNTATESGSLVHVESRLKALEEKHAGTITELRRTEKRLSEEREQKAKATAASERLQQQLKTLREAADMAKSQAEQSRVECERLETQVESHRRQCNTLRQEAETARTALHEQAQKAAEATEVANTASLRTNALENRLKTLEEARRDESSKVRAREEMLRLLREELASEQRRRRNAEAATMGTPQLISRAEASALDAEAERDDLREKLQLAMMESSARAAQQQQHAETQAGAEPAAAKP